MFCIRNISIVIQSENCVNSKFNKKFESYKQCYDNRSLYSTDTHEMRKVLQLKICNWRIFKKNFIKSLRKKSNKENINFLIWKVKTYDQVNDTKIFKINHYRIKNSRNIITLCIISYDLSKIISLYYRVNYMKKI